MSKNEPDKKDPQDTNNPDISGGYLKYLIYFLLFLMVMFWLWSPGGPAEITWTDFEEMVKNKKVESVKVIDREIAEVTLREDVEVNEEINDEDTPALFETTGAQYQFNIGTPEIFEDRLWRIQREFPEDEQAEVIYTSSTDWSWLLILAFPLLLLILIFSWGRRMSKGGAGGNMFSFGQSKAKMFTSHDKLGVSFKDVAGMEEAKAELQETVDFLKHPQNYTKLGARIPKGVLLAGPPGTGKTLVAKAVAGEAQVPFFSLSGSEFVEMFVGVGASRVRDLFNKAKEKAPCIIFIDELDAIGRSRGKNNSMGGANDERENTLNQLLTEMDGFTPNSGVIVLAATNRGEVLDKAIMRPGRFDRHIYLELPNNKERKDIFQVHMKHLNLEENVNTETLASQTPGFSGADIANVCNEAALLAARRKKKKVGQPEFSDALDRIVGGLENRSSVLSPEEKKTVAYHEAGHALATVLLKGIEGVVKVTIIPRGKSLGATWNKPEELKLLSLSKLKNEIKIMLAGRAAEDVIFEEVTSGALDDLERVSKQAYGMIAYYGLGEKVGNISYYDSSGQESFQKPYSEETGKMIDQEVRKLVDECYQDIKNMFLKQKNKLESIGKVLLEKEVIYRDDLKEILK
ncbi:ATP-dependent zinc metalloprotease FtsH [Cytophagaceae bacterium ABcell3]|nr:ATP-dependent zinc metalloprotease FtsH [Cytophagaceae bacterium ABcell3]